ncbi:TPA: hypothetical protein LUC54_001843 [Acinetobacter baumannii]|uniref:HNH endonuclease n=4 Tax=Acinetobacter baumannii TaxID=470 RepID=A0ABX6CF31_ACIB2|nr:hypothetical protein [Acinetobacter baumannii]ARN31518.1 hypothetical protein A4U85_12445 [Acinetobacter baumannii]EEX02427.1 hypothetical protein HMPREF0010_03096 [Acinetobacter baumannii ATCC 19606 = CIP 70.34 = JCM 6841]ENW74165.1 hypothetical protein F911_02673 [Acinetobacter baumannii ATCC 19606 = CIP 70.34 = JCM 6841]KFC03484.1 hypothetical protein DJ41_2335 [Acinetobacter baumannii ATCC 19606 = CIP 70.34 = JCM 6841]MBA8656551.1 hypothetical protein [Acinetobacter baumannii]
MFNSDECGIWSIWENGKWHGDFKFPDGVMTKLPEEKEPAMSEFKVGDRVLRHFNKKVYFVNHRVGDEEYLISYEKDTPVSKCQICEHFSNLKLVHEPDLGDNPHTENRIGRIDKPSDSRELENLDKLENHISPNCKVTEVHINEAYKLNRLG